MRERIDFTPEYGTKASQSIIKVMGVGGGGGNAVKYMYKEGIIGVDFLICNTDRNALEASPIPSKLVLGESGLGAGANPDVARQLALECREQIIEFIGPETKMLFITAGMGKGTGTGAAPVVAQIAKEMDILTIAVVTLPFHFEGLMRAQLAEAGIAELRKHVDSLIIIKNENLFKCYSNEKATHAFGYADNVLKNAVKCIAELITVHSEQNVDFNDIKSILKQSGSAMLGIAEASGDNRIEEVLAGVLQCPLLAEEYISNAKNFLFSISYGPEKSLLMSEFKELTERFEERKSKSANVIWGRSEDPMLGDKIKLSVIISNYSTDEKEVDTVVDITEITDGERLDGVQIVDLTTTTLTERSISTMKPVIEDGPQNITVIEAEPQNIRKVDRDFDFLNTPNPVETRRVAVVEPVIVPVPVPRVPVFETDGPQQIGSTYDPKYEDENEFAFLIGTPAIQRARQENKADFQDKAIQNNQPVPFVLEENMHEFFWNKPD